MTNLKMMEKIKEGYKKTEVGVIPDDWLVDTIGNTFEVCNNLRFPISQEVRKSIQGKYPYYGPTKIQDYIDHYRIDGTYALIGEDGDHFLKWNEQSMTLLATGKFNVNNHAHVIRGTKNLTEWFYFFFAHRDITPHLTRQGAGRYKLNKNTLVNIPCALPPTLAEQKAIATALSDVDELIQSLDKLIAKKKAIKQGSMQRLLKSPTEGGQRLPGFSGEWEVKKLGDLADFTNGKAHENAIVESGEYIVVNSKFISTEGQVKKYANQQLCPVKANGILMVMSDVPNGKAIAKCFFVYQENKYTLNQRICSLTSKYADSKFLFYLIDRNPYYLTFDDGVKQTNLRRDEVLNCPLTVPPTLEEQKAIAKILSDMDQEIDALEQKQEKYKAIKQGMMQALLTGKKRLV